MTDFRYNKLSENTLCIVRYKLAYLNFVDTCRGGYCALAQKYINTLLYYFKVAILLIMPKKPSTLLLISNIFENQISGIFLVKSSIFNKA